MSMVLNVAKIDLTNGIDQSPKRIVTSATSANVQLGTSLTLNPWNTTPGAGGPRNLAAKGIWLVYVSGSAVQVRFSLTPGAAVAVATDPTWGIGWVPLPVQIPPGTWVAAIGTATAGAVDFMHVDAFRD